MVDFDEGTLWALTRELSAACRKVSSKDSIYCTGSNCPVCPIQRAKARVAEMDHQLFMDRNKRDMVVAQ
jgi:hypothetical protein